MLIVVGCPLCLSKGLLGRTPSLDKDVLGMRGVALGVSRPEDQDAGQIDDPPRFALPSVGEMENGISWIKCSCGWE
jgi:hypothetical protein